MPMLKKCSVLLHWLNYMICYEEGGYKRAVFQNEAYNSMVGSDRITVATGSKPLAKCSNSATKPRCAGNTIDMMRT
jgi:hypothetical protein